jgi:hypothetical protein
MILGAGEGKELEVAVLTSRLRPSRCSTITSSSTNISATAFSLLSAPDMNLRRMLAGMRYAQRLECRRLRAGSVPYSNGNSTFRCESESESTLLILGRIEHLGKRQITIVGDTVNTASRIEGMTKELSAPILPSDKVVAYLPFVGTDRDLSGQCLLACAEREAPIESTRMMASAATAELRMILLREGYRLRKERERRLCLFAGRSVRVSSTRAR